MHHFFGDGPAQTNLYRLDLGPGRGVRDLASGRDGILVLAGPMRDVGGTCSIHRWDGVGNGVELLTDLPDHVDKKGKQWKPEALLRLDENAKGARVLLPLDGAKGGRPREVRIKAP